MGSTIDDVIGFDFEVDEKSILDRLLESTNVISTKFEKALVDKLNKAFENAGRKSGKAVQLGGVYQKLFDDFASASGDVDLLSKAIDNFAGRISYLDKISNKAKSQGIEGILDSLTVGDINKVLKNYDAIIEKQEKINEISSDINRKKITDKIEKDIAGIDQLIGKYGSKGIEEYNKKLEIFLTEKFKKNPNITPTIDTKKAADEYAALLTTFENLSKNGSKQGTEEYIKQQMELLSVMKQLQLFEQKNDLFKGFRTTQKESLPLFTKSINELEIQGVKQSVSRLISELTKELKSQISEMYDDVVETTAKYGKKRIEKKAATYDDVVRFLELNTSTKIKLKSGGKTSSSSNDDLTGINKFLVTMEEAKKKIDELASRNSVKLTQITSQNIDDVTELMGYLQRFKDLGGDIESLNLDRTVYNRFTKMEWLSANVISEEDKTTILNLRKEISKAVTSGIQDGINNIKNDQSTNRSSSTNSDNGKNVVDETNISDETVQQINNSLSAIKNEIEDIKTNIVNKTEGNSQLNSDIITEIESFKKIIENINSDNHNELILSTLQDIKENINKITIQTNPSNNIQFHEGNLRNLSSTFSNDNFGNMIDDLLAGEINRRGYGHGSGGTGLYAAKSIDDFQHFDRKDNQKVFGYAIDFSKYEKIFTPKTQDEAEKLLSFLSKLEAISIKIGSGYSGFDHVLENTDVDTLYNDYTNIFKSGLITFDEFKNFIDNMSQLVKTAGKIDGVFFTDIPDELSKSDNIATRFMKMNGYQGVDVHNIKSLDNMDVGSVIYDIKPESIIKEFLDSSEMFDYAKLISNTVVPSVETVFSEITSIIKDFKSLLSDSLSDFYGLKNELKSNNSIVNNAIDDKTQSQILSFSPTQEFDNDVQQNLVVLENYKNTIVEIDKLKLEPKTDETKRKIEELNKLADYFASRITDIRSENNTHVSPEMMEFGGVLNQNIMKNYNPDQIKELQKIAHDRYGVKANLPVPEFNYISEELNRIEQTSEGLRNALTKDLTESSQYVGRVKADLTNLVDTYEELQHVKEGTRDYELYQKDIDVFSKRSPEVLQFLDKIKTYDQVIEFVKTDEWLDFLATLPKAHTYLESIGYDFERIESNLSFATETPSQVKQDLIDTCEEVEEIENKIVTMYRAFNSTHGIMGNGISWFSDDLESVDSYYNNRSTNKDSLARLKADTSKFLSINANGGHWGEISYDGEIYTADELANMAKELGYIGIEIKNIYDTYNGINSGIMSTTYAIFDDNIIKDAENVTSELSSVINSFQELHDYIQTVLDNDFVGAGYTLKKEYHTAAEQFDEIFNQYKIGAISIEDAYKQINKIDELLLNETPVSTERVEQFVEHAAEQLPEQEVPASIKVKPVLDPQEFANEVTEQLKGFHSNINIEPTIDYPTHFVQSIDEQLISNGLSAHINVEPLPDFEFDADGFAKKVTDNLIGKSARIDVAFSETLDQNYSNIKNDSLNGLEGTIDNITQKVNEKTNAFVNEKNEVNSAVDVERNKLNKLKETVKSVTKAVNEKIQAFKNEEKSLDAITKAEQKAEKKQEKNEKEASLIEKEKDQRKIWDKYYEDAYKENFLFDKKREEENKKVNENRLRQLQQYNEEFKKIDTNKYPTEIVDTISNLGNLLKSYEDIDIISDDDLSQIKELFDIIKNSEKLASKSSVANLVFNIQKYLERNTKIPKETRLELEKLIQRLQQMDVVKSDVGKVNAEFKQLASEMSHAEKNGRSFIDIFKTKVLYVFAQQMASWFSFQDIIRYIRQAAQNVINLNTQFTELAKVSDSTIKQLNADFKSYANTAKEVGGTITDTIAATADWARMGYNIPDSKELAKVALIYKNVGDGIDISSANESLISTLQGFQMEAKDAMHIIDVFNETSNNFAISSSGIGEALQRSAASFYAANTDLEKSVALITTTNTVLQDPDSVGTLWKTLSARIRGAKTELEELNEETDEYTETTSKLRDLVKSLTGFDIMKDEDTFKDIYDIMIGIGKEWSKLTDVERASLGEALAG